MRRPRGRSDAGDVAGRVVGEADDASIGKRLRDDPVSGVVAELHGAGERIGDRGQAVRGVVAERGLAQPLAGGTDSAAGIVRDDRWVMRPQLREGRAAALVFVARRTTAFYPAKTLPLRSDR